jgi:integrase
VVFDSARSAGLRWRDIDWIKAMIYVRANASAGQRSTTKGGRVRSVPLVDALAGRLEVCSWAVDVWSVPDVKEFAGHRDISTTMKYVHRTAKTTTPPLLTRCSERC